MISVALNAFSLCTCVTLLKEIVKLLIFSLSMLDLLNHNLLLTADRELQVDGLQAAA